LSDFIESFRGISSKLHFEINDTLKAVIVALVKEN
jgi:hypothetical protein